MIEIHPAVVVMFVAYMIFWLFQFVQVMMLSDDDFPGRNDKTLWVIVFIVMFFIAPFAFMFWKRAYLLVRSDTNPHPRSKKH